MSGWIFSNGEILTANELTRLDPRAEVRLLQRLRIGDYSRPRRRPLNRVSTFFRGSLLQKRSCQFVCTAWPVDDAGARLFALSLYTALLGLPLVEPMKTGFEIVPRPMFEAMQAAREAICKTLGRAAHLGSLPTLRQSLFPTVRSTLGEDSERVPDLLRQLQISRRRLLQSNLLHLHRVQSLLLRRHPRQVWPCRLRPRRCQPPPFHLSKYKKPSIRTGTI